MMSSINNDDVVEVCACLFCFVLFYLYKTKACRGVNEVDWFILRTPAAWERFETF